MDKKVLSTVIQLRRGTEVQWEAIKNEFVPAAGEPCVTLDGANAGQIKVGNGIDSWGALKYSGVGGLDVTKIYGDTVDSSKATIDGVTYTTTSDAIAAVVAGTDYAAADHTHDTYTATEIDAMWNAVTIS